MHLYWDTPSTNKATTMGPHDELIDQLMQGYRRTAVLSAALELGVFEALADGPRSLGDLAGILGLPRRSLRILCDALLALKLLERDREQYRNSEATREHLLVESPHPRRSIALHAARLYHTWGQLADVVRRGAPLERDADSASAAAAPEEFARAMADVGRRDLDATFEALDLSSAKRLLDAGGGPGVYAEAAAHRWPQLEVTLFDRPATAQFAERRLRAEGLTNVRFLSGDLLHDDLGEGYDAILASNIVHSFGPVENAALVQRWAAALAPGGRLAIKDFILDPDRREPPDALLFAVNMLINTPAGDCYTVNDLESWCQGAGLTDIRRVVLDARSSILLARRPAT